MKFNFPIILVGNVKSESLSKAFLQEGADLLTISRYDDLQSINNLQSKASAFVIMYETESTENLKSMENLISEIRRKNSDVPLFIYGETQSPRELSNDILKEIKGFFEKNEDTSEFVAKHILSAARIYVEGLTPPFFKALLNYANNASYSWHCPGHQGGVAFLKSPVGQIFHQFFGENLLRADVCNAVEELGQLLDHTGPVARSEENAARIFNADHLFFVTNGTSTSNKIVWHANVRPDDIVVVDRNCHKSILHAIVMTGAIPVFLTPKRNHHGIIGPIPREEFSMESIQKKIDKNPFIKNKNRKPRLMTLTQSTYDGLTYNVKTIKKALDGKIDILHFDEAWLPHAAFHEFYNDMHAIEKAQPKTQESMVYSTQSTHKMLAGLSQASQILVSESESQKLNRSTFNEAFMMHTSTSPQYSIIASCDVAASMMDGPGGRALVEESIKEAMNFRRAMAKVGYEWSKGPSEKDWWFKVWGPTRLPEDGIGSREDWMLKSDEEWHGFGTVESGFNILDPVRATVLTPGLTADGTFEDLGIPANLVTKYLAEHGVIVEKCGLYSFFIMFTIGITKGRWNTMIAALQQFKEDFDQNKSIGKVMPKFASKYPQYENVGVKDLCAKIHLALKEADMARTTTETYVSEIEPAMKPSDAFSKLAHDEVERVDLDRLEGKVTAVLLTPYPPGIPLLIPGEKFNKSIVNYLKCARNFNQNFPGFETDVHGLVAEKINGTLKYSVDCLKSKSLAKIRSVTSQDFVSSANL